MDQVGVEQFAQAFAEQLRAERAASGMSYDDLVEATGIGRSTLLRVFSGERELKTTFMFQVLAAMNVDVATFVDRALHRVGR